MPAPEALLWSKLRAKQFNNFKFRRQYGIGHFVLDFYCSKKRLAIEIDGESHFNKNSIKYDKEREEKIKSNNIKIIRFTNKEIMENLEGVLIAIEQATNTSLNPS